MLLPFDAHNHVHMGPTPLGQANLDGCLSGMAIMSTHPRDFPSVLELAVNEPTSTITILPCVGVHPWFLHELTEVDWAVTTGDIPQWIADMEQLLLEHPQMPVGEIGLDNFHFDPTTKNLTCPLETQVEALEHQLALAIKYQRPVSVHCVRAMGKVMDALSKVQKEHKALPPRIYFHAFGGKAATVTQLAKSLEKKQATKVYFGFAPIVNFASPKTIEVLQTVGLDRLVMETDHEDAARVPSSMRLGLEVISEALGVSQEELITRTNRNARELYGLG
jgi:TatD DNase family protein